MTVLSKYQRLECSGVWQAAPDGQRRDVYVALGEATIIIRDGTDTALAHWSLPAIERTNPGTTPALYRPGRDADETLEIADDTMIDAIRTVQRAVAGTKPHPGRLRRAVLLAGAGAGLALIGWWLPTALVTHTADVLPKSVRDDIGQRLLAQLVPYAGHECSEPSGLAALDTLRRRVLGADEWDVIVVRGGPRTSAILPGRIILLRRDLIESTTSPAAAAGALLVESARAAAEDPMIPLMRDAGPIATLRLLTRGTVQDSVLADHAASLLVTEMPTPDIDALSRRFDQAGVPMLPYLDAAEPPETVPTAAAASSARSVLLPDQTWLRLRAICE